ncbi:MAG: EAL domain-containing protein [Cyanobacteria bacterium P01_A01_bin.83]
MKNTILLVDDHPNNLQLLFKYLNNIGYKILIAQNGINAIKTAEKIIPDLILLDVMMAELDGFAVCRHLKANPDTRDIPVIFMTGLTETQDKVKGFKLGAVDYLTKPIQEEELLARIKIHLSLHNLNQRLAKDSARQKLLFEISDRIRQSLDLDVILKTATSEIRFLLDCDVVGLAQISNQEISLQAYSAVDEYEINSQKPISYCCLLPNSEKYQFYLQGNICVIEEAETEFCSLINPSIKPQSRIIAPILIKSTDAIKNPSVNLSRDSTIDNSTLWGWLIIDQYKCSRHWQEKETFFVKELTTQLAIAIQQGLLHQKLSQMAIVDSLTNVYNRRYFDRQFNLEWNRLKRISSPLSLIMCDVDCFKIYNDTYGHQKGDQCLQQIAQTIANTIKRPADFLARYGGEEFVIILPHTPLEGAIKVANTIRIAVENLNIPHQNSLVDSAVVTISTGVASTIPNSQDNPQLLGKASDLALYQSKKRGRNCVSFYCDPISHSNAEQQQKINWVKRLRSALKNNLFSLYAQPIKALGINDSRKYFEILLRLTDQENQVVLPGVFLDIAERNFLMSDIDTWVIDSLFKTLEGCDCTKWQNYRFAINLSGASLNNQPFMQFLSQKLISSPLPGHLFCFEITENVAISDINRVLEFIKTFKNLGCSFALDDFGKGMSSLTYLKNLPVDYLKIDGSFIRELDNNQASKVMVEAINYIAEGIGLKTIAEFVENRTIFESVLSLNVDYAQGFHLGSPEVLTKAIS